MQSVKLIMIMSLVALLSACSMSSGDNLPEKESMDVVEKINVKTMAVKPQDVQLTKTYFGKTLFSWSMTYAAEVPGIIQNLNIKPGQRVAKGQVLVTFPPTNHNLQIEQAQIAYDELKEAYDRQKLLQENGAVTKLSLDQIKTQLDIQERALSQVQQVNIIKAAFDGIITEVNVVKGEQLAPGTPVFSLAKPEKMKVEFFLTGKDMELVQLGDKVNIDNNGKKLQGVIVKKAFQVDPVRRALKVEAAFEGNTHLPLAGSTVELSVKMQQLNDVLLIPEEVVMTSGKNHFVFLAKDGKAAVRKVIPAQRIGLNMVITEGIAPNDQLIIAGMEKLENETVIEIIN